MIREPGFGTAEGRWVVVICPQESGAEEGPAQASARALPGGSGARRSTGSSAMAYTIYEAPALECVPCTLRPREAPSRARADACFFFHPHVGVSDSGRSRLIPLACTSQAKVRLPCLGGGLLWLAGSAAIHLWQQRVPPMPQYG